MSMKRIFAQLVVVTSLTLSFTLTSIVPAQAITVNFSWHGNQGYSATGTFHYDEKTAPDIISEKGGFETKGLDKFTVYFYAPSNQKIINYANISSGVLRGNYFQFNFNTIAQKILGSIDIGGESSGDMYLKGTVDTRLSLIQVSASGAEERVDSNFGAIVVQSSVN